MSTEKNERIGMYLLQMWATILFLAYFALIQPVNRMLFLIRQTGVISVSVGSILENKDIIFPVVFAELLKWLLIVIIWSVAIAVIFWIYKRKPSAFNLLSGLAHNRRIQDGLFYVGVFIEMIWAAFYYSSFQIPFASFWVFIALVCFSTRILVSEYSKREWIVIVLLISLGILCELLTTRCFVLRVVLLLIASKNINWKMILKWYLAINSLAFGVIVLCSVMGIKGGLLEIDSFRSATEMANRYLLGFNSPNTTSYIIVKLGLVAIYLWWDKLKLWHMMIFAGVNYVMYMLTDSRTSFLVGMLAIIMVLFYKYVRVCRDWKVWSILSVVLIVGLAAFSLHLLQWNFHEYDDLRICPSYVYKVNDIIFGRIHQALKFTREIGISPFGYMKSEVFCDMGYIKFFYQEGFIVYAIYFMMVFKTLFWQQKKKEYSFIIIIVVMSIRMFMESSFVPFVFQNVILMLFIGRWDEIFCKNDEENRFT